MQSAHRHLHIGDDRSPSQGDLFSHWRVAYAWFCQKFSHDLYEWRMNGWLAAQNASGKKGDGTVNCLDSIFAAHHQPTQWSRAYHIEHRLIDRIISTQWWIIFRVETGKKRYFRTSDEVKLIRHPLHSRQIDNCPMDFFSPKSNEQPSKSKIMRQQSENIQKINKWRTRGE